MNCVTHVTICIFHGNLCTTVNDNVTAALGINSSLPTTATCIQRTRASDRKRSVCHLNRVTTTANSIVLTDQGDGQIVGCFDTTGIFSCICNIYLVQRQCICIRRVCDSRSTIRIGNAKNIVLVRAGNLLVADPNVIVDNSGGDFHIFVASKIILTIVHGSFRLIVCTSLYGTGSRKSLASKRFAIALRGQSGRVFDFNRATRTVRSITSQNSNAAFSSSSVVCICSSNSSVICNRNRAVLGM